MELRRLKIESESMRSSLAMPTNVCRALRFGSETKSPYKERGEKLVSLANSPALMK